MGNKSGTLTAWEAEAPYSRVTESRLVCIQHLDVCNKTVLWLLTVKAASLVNLTSLTVSADIDVWMQKKTADNLIFLPSLSTVTFAKHAPSGCMLEAILRHPTVTTLVLRQIDVSPALCRLMAEIVPVSRLRLLRLEEVRVPGELVDFTRRLPPQCLLETIRIKR